MSLGEDGETHDSSRVLGILTAYELGLAKSVHLSVIRMTGHSSSCWTDGTHIVQSRSEWAEFVHPFDRLSFH